MFKKSKDVFVIDKHLVRLECPPKETRPGKLIPVSKKDNENK